MKEIAKNIHLLALKGVNAYLIEHDNTLSLIDTGYAGNGEKIMGYIQKIGRRPAELENIIITHLHTDHTGSLAELAELADAKVIMSVEDARLVEEGVSFREELEVSPGLMHKIAYRLFVKNAPKTITPVKVNQYLKPEDDFLAIGKGFRVISVPGHAKGQKALLYQEHGGILFAADTCGNMMGLGIAPFYENYQLGIRDLKSLAGYEFDKMVFGHGKPLMGNAANKFRKRFSRYFKVEKFATTP